MNPYPSQTSYGSSPQNGQLVPEYTGAAMFPSPAWIPYMQGRGAYTPTLPPPISLGGSSDSWSTGMMANEAGQDPFNPIKSSVVWALGALLIGVMGLRHIHWRG